MTTRQEDGLRATLMSAERLQQELGGMIERERSIHHELVVQKKLMKEGETIELPIVTVSILRSILSTAKLASDHLVVELSVTLQRHGVKF